jgi:hypothetical protein
MCFDKVLISGTIRHLGGRLAEPTERKDTMDKELFWGHFCFSVIPVLVLMMVLLTSTGIYTTDVSAFPAQNFVPLTSTPTVTPDNLTPSPLQPALLLDLPDLVAADILSVTAPLRAGEIETLLMTVSNNGTATTCPATFWIQVKIDGVSVYEESTLSCLGVGGFVQVFVNKTLGGGYHTIELSADSRGKITELSEDNNTLQRTWWWAGQPPVAQFSANPRRGYAPLMVQFTDQSTGAITSRTWDLGGQTSTATNPSLVYVEPGKKTVKLTVAGPDGSDDETKMDYIEVVEPHYVYLPLVVRNSWR